MWLIHTKLIHLTLLICISNSVFQQGTTGLKLTTFPLLAKMITGNATRGLAFPTHNTHGGSGVSNKLLTNETRMALFEVTNLDREFYKYVQAQARATILPPIN